MGWITSDRADGTGWDGAGQDRTERNRTEIQKTDSIGIQYRQTDYTGMNRLIRVFGAFLLAGWLAM